MQEQELPPGPMLDAYWVVPGQFMAGMHPGLPYQIDPQSLLLALLDAGITTFVDLTEPRVHDPYENRVKYLAARYGKTVHYYRFPIRDMGVPDSAGMQTILDTIDHEITEGEAVYVHCMAGLGRTGTVVGCYLVRHGLTGPQALEELNRLRQHTRSYDLESPIRANQVKMVRDWPVGQ